MRGLPCTAAARTLRGSVGLAVLLGVLLGTLVVCCGCGRDGRRAGRLSRAGPRGRYNVVLIVADALRADHLGCYGYARKTSPTIDRLASEGVLFTQMFSQSSVTGAAHVAMLASRLPTDVGLLENSGVVPDSVQTLAEVLRGCGYATGAFVSNNVLTRELMRGLEQGFAVYDCKLPTFEPNRLLWRRECKDTNAAALAWLGKAPEPFFLWVHYLAPHGPYATRATEKVREFEGDAIAAAQHRWLPHLKENWGPNGIPRYQMVSGLHDAASYIARYDAYTFEMDAAVGELLAALKSKGVAERTLVALTSDHGESLGEHGYYFQHGHDLTEEVLRVPLILSLPGGPRDLRVTSLAQMVDLMPTVLDAVRLRDQLPRGARGISLLSKPKRGRAPGRTVISAVISHTTHKPVYSARRGDWKLILSQGGAGPRLFFLPKDPGEMENLASTRPKVLAEMSAELAAHLRRPYQRGPARMDQQTREVLRALGYLN